MYNELLLDAFTVIHIPKKYVYYYTGGFMTVRECTYRMAGNFRGVLIFVIFVVDLAVTKISTNEN